MATFTGADKAIGFLFDMVANIADDYNSENTYAVGAYVIYEGTLYKCTTAISNPESFTPAHWQTVLIMDEVSAGGGGGGTTVIANPAGSATDTLNKLQVGSTIYDVPSGGGSGHNYSTTEQIVGTWIDGSTVYEKTVDFGQNILINSNTWYTTNISTVGISAIIQAFGTNGDGTFFGFLGMSRDGTYCNLLQTRNAAITIRYLTFRYLKTS